MLAAFLAFTYQIMHRRRQRKKGFEIALKADFGRGDKIRTCDFYVPNRKSLVK